MDKVLEKLAETNDKTARVFELRFFGGLRIEETAEVMETSAATKREWGIAAFFFQREMFKG